MSPGKGCCCLGIPPKQDHRCGGGHRERCHLTEDSGGLESLCADFLHLLHPICVFCMIPWFSGVLFLLLQRHPPPPLVVWFVQI